MSTNHSNPLLDFALSIPTDGLPVVGTDARNNIEEGFITALAESIGSDAVAHPVPYVNDDEYIDFNTDVDMPGMLDALTIDFRLTVPKDGGIPYIVARAIDRTLGTEYAEGTQEPIVSPRALAEKVAEKAKAVFQMRKK